MLVDSLRRPTQPSNNPVVNEDNTFHGLTKLNSDLLQQNSQLRVERDTLKSKLSVFQGSFDSDLSEDPHQNIGTTKDVMKEVDRILNPAGFSIV